MKTQPTDAEVEGAPPAPAVSGSAPALATAERYPAYAIAPIEGLTVPGLPPVSGRLHVDQFGYLPEAEKVAVISDPVEGYNAQDDFEPSPELEVRRRSDGSVAFSGPVTAWAAGAVDATSGDRGWWFDFSALEETGAYYLYDPVRAVRSAVFEIDPAVYYPVLKAAVRTYFYQRLNTRIAAPYAEAPWFFEAALGQDREARLVHAKDDPSTARDLHGGWMDAGDSNKYPTFNNEVIHPLLYSFRHFPELFGDDFGIPESGNGLPDLLDEVKWQLDWLIRMQEPDGGVLLKVGFIDNNYQCPLSADQRPRYYLPSCSASTLSFAGIAAHAARVYGEFDVWRPFEDELRRRALAAWSWYEANPRTTDLDTGEVKAGIANRTLEEQDRIEAQVTFHLWRLTGDEAFHARFLAAAPKTRQLGEHRWSIYEAGANEVLLEYLDSPGADPAFVERIQRHLLRSARDPKWAPPATAHLYRAWLPKSVYHWGSLRLLSAQGFLSTAAAEEVGDEALKSHLRRRAAGLLHYLHGVNPLGLVYLTNMEDLGAERSVRRLYHHRFGIRSPFSGNPAPGYVVGGPNQHYSGRGPESDPGMMDWLREQPPEKAFAETDLPWPTNSWEITENAIYYQASYLRLLAFFVRPPSGTLSPND